MHTTNIILLGCFCTWQRSKQFHFTVIFSCFLLLVRWLFPFQNGTRHVNDRLCLAHFFFFKL